MKKSLVTMGVLGIAIIATAQTEVLRIELNDGKIQTINVNDIKEMTFDISDEVSELNGHEAVDLGLSVRWAACNVGADTPTVFGGYYAWGETEEKMEYTRGNYTDINPGRKDMSICGTQWDAAYVKWGGSWRMPTYDELEELVEICSWKWTTTDGINGYQVTGPNGKSIFLPAGGRKCDDPGYGGLSYDNDNCYYRVGSHQGGYTYFINASSGYIDIDRDSDYRTLGFSIRAVTK